MIEPNGRKYSVRADMEAGGHRIHSARRALLCPRAWGVGSSRQWEPEGEVTKSTQASMADRGQPAKALGRREWGPGLNWVGVPGLHLKKGNDPTAAIVTSQSPGSILKPTLI